MTHEEVQRTIKLSAKTATEEPINTPISEIKSPASRRLKFQLVFTVIFVALGLLVTWLILGEASPFHRYFLYHVSLPNLWAMTVLIPFILAAVLSGNPHSPPTVIVVLFTIIQWSIVGLIFSFPVSRLWFRLQKKSR